MHISKYANGQRGLPRKNALATRTCNIREQESSVRGQSLFELVVAIAISALIIVAIASLVTNSIRNANFSRDNALATSYAQNTIEWLRVQRDSDITAFMQKVSLNDPAPTTYCFVDLNWDISTACGDAQVIQNTPFKREGVFTLTTDSGTGKTIIQTDISVSWQDGTQLHEVTTSTDFTDPRQK